MKEKLTVHSHLLVSSMVLHLVIIVQRVVVIGSVESIPKMVAINAGVGLLGVSGIITIITFILFIIRKARKTVPKLIFVCIISFNVVVDIGGACCFGVFVGFTENYNAKVFAYGCLITNGIAVIVEVVVILLFFVCKPPGIKSYRPVEDDDGAPSKGK